MLETRRLPRFRDFTTPLVQIALMALLTVSTVGVVAVTRPLTRCDASPGGCRYAPSNQTTAWWNGIDLAQHTATAVDGCPPPGTSFSGTL